MAPITQVDTDFFVSYSGKDLAWAEWIAWHLEQYGFRTLIQAWDFKSGGVFPGDMHRALKKSARVLAVLTPSYMESGFCQPEWQAAFAEDPTGEKGNLVCVRVVDCEPDGLLRGRTYIDLVGLSETDARALLLTRLKNGRSKPPSAPPFPSGSFETAPEFPGLTGIPERMPRHSTKIPNNLPSLQPFFGREEELKMVREALDPESRTWGAVIDGPGGIGKTSLAVRAAYECHPGQFDRIIFVSAKDRELDDDGVRALGMFVLRGIIEMLNELARELGHPEIAKAPEEHRFRLVFDALRTTKTLLILDNLESLSKSDQDQLFMILKRLPGTCKAIVTSRQRIGPGSEEINLEQLSLNAALAMLIDQGRRNPLLARTSEIERITLYKETGGKPLLLRWLVGQLGRGNCRTFVDALQFLRTCPPENDPLEFIFGDLVQEFTEPETNVLCALTHFSIPAKAEHISGIVDCDTESIRIALRSLANRSLVVPDQEEKTFILLPMVAVFLRRKRLPIILQIGIRLADSALKILIENGFKAYHRFDLIEESWPMVLAALPLFLSSETQHLASVSFALENFLDFSGRWDEWLSFCREAEAMSQAATPNAARMAYQAGLIYYKRLQPQEIQACAKRITKYLIMVPNGCRIRPMSIHLESLAHELQGNHDAAIEGLRQLLRIGSQWLDITHGVSPNAQSESQAIDPIKSHWLNQLADNYRKKGDLKTAKMLYEEARAVAIRVNDREQMALAAGNLAELALERKDWQNAEELAGEAISLSERLGRRELIASNCRRVASSLAGQGRNADALAHARRAVEILTILRLPELEKARQILTNCDK